MQTINIKDGMCSHLVISKIQLIRWRYIYWGILLT